MFSEIKNAVYIIYRLQTSLRQHKQAQFSRTNATNENTGETNQANENDDGQLKSKNIYSRGRNKRNKHKKRSQARRHTVLNALQHRTRRSNKGCRTGQSYYGECISSNSLRRRPSTHSKRLKESGSGAAKASYRNGKDKREAYSSTKIRSNT
jgi:hypothetical protein